MAFWTALPIIGKVVEKGLGIIDKAVPDKDLAEKLKHEFEKGLAEMDYSYLEKEIEARAKIISAEAGGTGLASQWRPITMLVFVYIIAHNHIIAPLFSVAYLPTPPELWELLKLGLGGYILGRTGEKMIKTWKGKEGG